MKTRLGAMRGVLSPRGFTAFGPADGTPVPEGAVRDDRCEAAREVRDWFDGKLRAFRTPVDLAGNPPFRRAVMEAMLAIPYGETVTYADIARRVGKPKASRAVGQAVGSNPVAVVVPCHRVVGSGGALTGFGFGLPAKRELLAIEGVEVTGPGAGRVPARGDLPLFWG